MSNENWGGFWSGDHDFAKQSTCDEVSIVSGGFRISQRGRQLQRWGCQPIIWSIFSRKQFSVCHAKSRHDNYDLSFEETIWSSTYAMATLKHRWQEEVTNWKDHLKLYTWIASFQHAEGRSANVICSAVRSKKGNGVKKLLLFLHCMKYSFVSLCSDVSTSSTRGSKVFVHLPLAVM